MQENQTESPKIIYEEHLRIINGIKFTPREIDIASCLAAGKDASMTAFLLKISPRTVENNLSSIRKKLDYGSSQAILKFMEKSGKLSWLHKYYLGISGQSVPENLNLNLTHKEPFAIKGYFQKFLNLSIYMKVVTIITSMGFFGFCLWALALGGISVTSPTKELPIRSELKIPAESGFLDRKELIKKIEDKLKGNQGIERVALVGVVGIGGAGKTTLARQYGLLQNASVVWEINTETKDSLVNSFRELAQKLAKTKEKKESLDFVQAIQTPDEREKQLLSLIKDWLRERSNWVLIYDNVESLAEMKTYFPEDAKVWGKGKVIITTRDKNIENTSYIDPKTIINIEELSEEEKLTLFSKIIFNCEPDKLTQNKKEEATNFLKNIPPFPLDIRSAAYYLKDSDMSYDEYVKKITGDNKNFYKSQEDFIEERKDTYHKNRYEIVTLSLKKMMKLDPKFKGLLFFIALLDSQNIPKELLGFYTEPKVVNKFITNLKKQGLLTGNAFSQDHADLFSIHRSIQRIILNFLTDTLSLKEKSIFLENITKSIQIFYDSCNKSIYTPCNKDSNIQCEKANHLLIHLDAITDKLKSK